MTRSRSRIYRLARHLSNINIADRKAANLEGANLEGANLEGANLEGANLDGAIGITVEQVKKAKNWSKALYSEEFREKIEFY